MAKRLLAATALAAAHGLPAIAAAPVGRSIFRTIRRVTAPGRVGLTFDDGPEVQALESFLPALAELNVKATFFIVGEQVRAAPEAARSIAAAGHEIAAHGYRHRNHLRVGPRETIRDLSQAKATIEGETGAEIRYFRPPYGVFNSASWWGAESLGWQRVLWARWGRDWEKRATPESIQAKVLGGSSGIRAGDIILLHDAMRYSAPNSWRRTLASLAPLVTELRRRGLEPEPVGSLLGPPAGRLLGPPKGEEPSQG